MPLDISHAPSKYLGYGVALLEVAGGLVIIFNVLGLTLIPMMRYTLGIVLVLLGIYRYVITKAKHDMTIIEETRKALNNEENDGF